MNQERLIQDPLGRNIWVEAIQPLQSIMQGYSERSRRPARAKTALQAKIYKQSLAGVSDRKIWEDAKGLADVYPEVVRQHRSRFKKKIRPKG